MSSDSKGVEVGTEESLEATSCSLRHIDRCGAKQQPAWKTWAVRVLAAVNAIFLIVVLLYVSLRYHFFPITENRSPWWPWASCWDEVCPEAECCSQFLVDEYSFTHYNHGFYLFPVLYTIPLRFWVFPRFGAARNPMSFDWVGFHISMFLEILWEGFENTEYIVNKFRETSAPDYNGDSGWNVFGDVLVCQLGFVAIEATLNYSYRRYGACIMVAAIALHIVLMEGIFWAWVCDGLLIIWVNLSGFKTISICGPNNYHVYLTLAIMVVVAGWALPCALARMAARSRCQGEGQEGGDGPTKVGAAQAEEPVEAASVEETSVSAPGSTRPDLPSQPPTPP